MQKKIENLHDRIEDLIEENKKLKEQILILKKEIYRSQFTRLDTKKYANDITSGLKLEDVLKMTSIMKSEDIDWEAAKKSKERLMKFIKENEKKKKEAKALKKKYKLKDKTTRETLEASST